MRSMWISPSIAVLAVVATAGAGYPQGLENGKKEFLSSCASCHGVTGKGDGPLAQGLKRPPADLTKLAEANKGVFPISRVYETIDGRTEVEMHGKRDMPVWGNVYKPAWWAGPEVSTEVAESIVRVRILALIEYISTLQSK